MGPRMTTLLFRRENLDMLRIKFLSLFLSFAVAAGSITSPLRAQDKTTQPTTAQQTSTEPKQESPPFRGLDANLYMQTSGEYRALCYQCFAIAKMQLDRKISESPNPSRPRAVVLDLDETVLDNSGFQTEQLRQGLAYDFKRWEQWEKNGADQVELIPGAKAFIEELKRLQIQAVYITNRNDDQKAQTMAALRRHGIDVPDDLLLCANAKTGSNKNSRRDLVRERYEVLLWIGDNLRDFDDVFRYNQETGIDGRKKIVDDHESHFGTDWIMLPNPAYGEWTKPFQQNESDLQFLRPVQTPASQTTQSP